MNWGHKIIVIYVIFVAGILFLVFRSSIQNQDLVTQDYYEQELKYQQKIDETDRANKLSAPLKHTISGNELSVQFPPEMKDIPLQANILLYCTADKRKDIELDINTTKASVRFPIPVINKGLHELKINWMAGGVSYYYSSKIFIQ